MKKKIFTLTTCIAMASTMQAQNIVVNLSDGKQVTYPKEDITNIEFTPEEYTGKLYYATTDMTFAEFFAGELHQSAEALAADGVDAFTSATSRKSANFSACAVSDDNTQILGVKAVNVAMTEEVYNALSEEQKARFTFVEDADFSKFKTLKADGSFSAYNSTPKSIEGNVVLSAGQGVAWGNYLLNLGIDNSAVSMADVQGAVVTTSNGQKFALIPLNNLYTKPNEAAFSVKAFTEPHGNKISYGHTAGLQGKTITNFTYLLKDNENVSIDCNVYVKRQTEAQTTVDGAAVSGTNPRVFLTFTDVPADANFTVGKVTKGSGRQAVTLKDGEDYTYSNGILRLVGDVAAKDQYVITFNSDKYISIGTTITFEETGAATALQQKLGGTYVELFSDQGFTAEKWDSLWIAECAKFVGEEQASAAAAQLKSFCQGTLIGEEAVKANTENGSTQFSCQFRNGISKFVFDGERNITGYDADGKVLFSHNYNIYDGTPEYEYYIYKSEDDNEDEFTYFAFFPDNPKDTYHIEFRYGDNIEALNELTTGKYAYWMAAGVWENDDKQCEEAIKKFIAENLGSEKE